MMLRTPLVTIGCLILALGMPVSSPADAQDAAPSETVNPEDSDPSELVLPDGVEIKDGSIETIDDKPLTQEQIDFMNARTSGCFAYAQAWTPHGGGVYGRGYSVGSSCGNYRVCGSMFSSTTGYRVDGEWCSSVGGSQSPLVTYTCQNPECGIVRAYLYTSGGTLVDFHTAPDQPCS